MESISSNVMSSLTKGSGIDIQKLARDLADVEKNPREERLLNFKSQEESKISAFSVLKYNVEELINQFYGINDASELSEPKVSISDSPLLSVVSTNGLASAGQHEIAISSLATAQRNFSNQYTSEDVSLNGGSGFNITHTSAAGGSTSINIESGNDTPKGVVAAINASGLELRATLVKEDNDGTQYRIVLQGGTGQQSRFSISSDLSDADLGFHDGVNGNLITSDGIAASRHAANASLTVNGLAIVRGENTINDVIPGLTFNLNGAHTGSNTDRIFITPDDATLKNKLKSLVSAYNDLQFALTELVSSESNTDELSGALQRDLAAIRTVRDAVYEAITTQSSSASGNISGFRDIGVVLTKDGNLEFDESEYDSVALTAFSDITQMLSAGTTNQSRYDDSAQGLAMDAIMQLESLTDNFTGVFAIRSNTASKNLQRIESDLQKLNDRTEVIYQRYLAQFTVMETLVNQLNNTRESMTDSWNNLGLYKD